MALNQKTKKAVAIGIIFAVVLLATWLLAGIGSLDRMQLQLSSLLYQTRNSSTPIVMVGVDQATIEKMGQTASWTRDNYAQAINNISKYNPAVIGLDYVFISKSKVIPTSKLEEIIADNQSSAEIGTEVVKLAGSNLNQYDQALADVIKSNEKVVMIYPAIAGFSEEILSKNNVVVLDLFKDFMPTDAFRLGISNTLTEVDGSIRRYAPLVRGSKDYLSFGLAIIAKYRDAKEVKVIGFDENEASIDIDGKTLKIPLENSQFLINFASKPVYDTEEAKKDPNFKYVRFVDAYNDDWNELSPSELEGKIVLIGPYVQNNDNYKVPIDNDYRMTGVQVHAQAIQTILDEAWLRNMGVGEMMVVVGFMTILSLLMIFILRVRWAVLAAAALVMIYVLVIGPLAFRGGVIVNLIYPPLAVILATILAYAYRYVTEFRQKMRVAGALGQYVNTDVAEQVVNDDKALMAGGGEKKLITVLFTDIAGFTTISEGLQPQSVVTLINEYFEVMAAVVVRNGGQIDKYIGDALMALFEGEGHAERAAKTTLEMREELTKLLAKWELDGPLPGGEKRPVIDFRAGLSTGEAVLGNIGSSHHIQFTAIGDIVNLGSRLESANKKYSTRIMVAQETFEMLQGKYIFRFLDLLEVKGKNKAVDVYELIGPLGSISEDQTELLKAYKRGLEKYFERDFTGALAIFEEEILKRWPKDNLSTIYAGRCHRLIAFPPTPDWDFVFKMENK